MRSLISINDLTKEEILEILKKATAFKRKGPENLLKGSILASCFFDPSTRTRLSFESAMLRLGGSVITVADKNSTSVQKGESLSDTMRVIGGYADIIVLRHPLEGSARLAASVTSLPVINAGDGANQHPSQTLLDLFSIQESQGRLDELKIAFVGDLKYGRTVHSLALAASLFNMRLYFVSPESLSLPRTTRQQLKIRDVNVSFHLSVDELIDKVDVIYMTRLQKERFAEGESHAPGGRFNLTLQKLQGAKKNLRILHPLPRVDELDPLIDTTPFAYYFEQAKNGLFVREALLAFLLKRL